VDVVASGDGEPDRLGHLLDQIHHVGLGDGQQALVGVDAGCHGHDGRPDAVAVVVRHPLDGPHPLEGGQQPGHRAGREAQAPRKFAYATRVAGHLLKDLERPIDALNRQHCQAPVRIYGASHFAGNLSRVMDRPTFDL
jgi:hypothetical protein